VGDCNVGALAVRCRIGAHVREDVPAARAAGQSSRARLADLLIASTAAANGLPLHTRKPSNFDALKRILKVIST
jgi:predicted nucleic acid-binding protein